MAQKDMQRRNFSRIVQETLDASGLEKGEFAALVETSRQNINNWLGQDGMSGLKDPTKFTRSLIALAKQRNQSLEDLIAEIEAGGITEEEETPDPKQIDRGLIGKLVSASTSTKLAALQVISTFFSKPEAIAPIAFEPIHPDQVVRQRAKLISDLALSLVPASSDNGHSYVTEVFYWMVRESALTEFKRSLTEAIDREGMQGILKRGQFNSEEEILSLLNGDRLPVVPQELQKLSGILRKADGDEYSDEELLDLFDVPKKARSDERQLNEPSVLV